MGSVAERNIVAVLSLCQSCASLIHEHNSERPDPNEEVNELARKLLTAAQDALAAVSTDLSLKEADQIKGKMSQAISALPDFAGTQAQENAYYLSVTLGLLDELFRNIRDIRKRNHLELVEDAVQQLHRHFDPELDFAHVYEQSSEAVEVWIKHFNQ